MSSFYISNANQDATHYLPDGQIVTKRTFMFNHSIDTRIKITQEELDKRIKFDRIWKLSLGLHGKQLDTSDVDIEGLDLGVINE
jgi:hypothetical protein